MFQLEDCIAYITSRGAKTLAERLEDRFTGSGVSRVQWIAMYYVDRCPSITQKQLAERMNSKESTVVRRLDRMEKENMAVSYTHLRLLGHRGLGIPHTDQPPLRIRDHFRGGKQDRVTRGGMFGK